MARERHHSSHPLPERAANVLSLPSVAELLSSRPPPQDSISISPRQHHPPQDPPRFAQPPNPSQRSTPPIVHSVISTANGAAAAADPSYSPALHHASQTSPTDTTTSTSPHDHQQQYYQPYPSQLKNHFNPSYPQDPTHSHLQSHVHRQDSAVSQQRLDIARATHSSEFPAYHSHKSPNDNRQSSSPRVSNSSQSPSSAHPTGSTPYSYPSNHPTNTHPPQRGYATSPPATHITLDGSRTHDAVSPAPPAPSSLDPPHQPNTRQARYNVRFAANQTPDNMPSFPKPRQDAPLAPSSPESREPVSAPKEQQTPPAVEPALQFLRQSEEEPVESSRPGHVEPSVERCSGCGATWTRPLPEMIGNEQNSSSSNGARSVMAMLWAVEKNRDLLHSHGRKADAQYEKWKWQHSQCPQPNGHDQRNRSSSPYYSDGARSRSDGGARDRNGTDSAKNKRKADSSSRDDGETSSKQRKVTAEPVSNVARPVQAPAST